MSAQPVLFDRSGQVNVYNSQFTMIHAGDAKSEVDLPGIAKLRERISFAAFHNSKERSEEVDPQVVGDIIHEWLSRLQSLPTISTATIELSSSSAARPWSNPATFFSKITTTHTPEDVLKDIFNWLYDQSSRFLIMWVHDDRRDQTSLLAQVVAEVLHERCELSASFFSSNRGDAHGDNRKTSVSHVIPSLAFQISQNIPQSRALIAKNVYYNGSVFRLKTDAQVKKLLVEPLEKASAVLPSEEANMGTRFIVIHGLEDLDLEDDDDDDNNNFQKPFLHAISQGLRCLNSGSYPQKLLILGRHTNLLNECLLESRIRSLVLHRPVILDHLVTKAEELKQWEKELAVREDGVKCRQRAIEQWEAKLKTMKRDLAEAQRKTAAKLEEDMRKLDEKFRKRAEGVERPLHEQQRANQQRERQLRADEGNLIEGAARREAELMKLKEVQPKRLEEELEQRSRKQEEEHEQNNWWS